MGDDIRVLLVDDHILFREGLSRLLEIEPDLRITGSCSSVTEALSIIDRQNVDLVLLDYNLEDEQGLVLLEGLKQRDFKGRVLVVTAGMNDRTILWALENGSSGIFLKHSPPSQLVKAIHKVMAGEMWLDSRAVRLLVAGVGEGLKKRRTLDPSVREQAILKGVFEGLSNKKIAVKLQISEASVKWTIQRLFDKTGARTRSQLVRIALENHDLK